MCYVYRLWLRSLISKAHLEICPDIYEAKEMLMGNILYVAVLWWIT